jgi:D-3-phosphoglycerate dehydrogenase
MVTAKIVYPDANENIGEEITDARRARLDALGGIEIHTGRPADVTDFVARIGGARAVILGWDMPAEAMRLAPNIEVISFLGIGAAKFVDFGEAERLGITVTNAPDYSANSVAEHALALMFATARRIVGNDRTTRSGEWNQSLAGFELAGKTLGLIGLGGIGKRLAQMASAIGMRVIAWTRNPSPARAAEAGVEFVSLDTVLGESDVISLHLMVTPETEGLIGAAELDATKPGIVVINTARAELMDEAALVERLRSGRVAAAGLDVFATEPLPADDPLTALDNVVLAPHIGYNTPEAVAALLEITIDNLVAYYDGAPINVVAGPGG